MSDVWKSTLISDALLVNPTLPPQVTDKGWLLVEGGRIKAMGRGAPPAEWVRAADHRVSARGGILLPGLVNAHNHAAMTLFRGLADDLPLKEWLEGTIFPVEARVVDEAFVHWGTLLACAEMIRSGTTAFANAYFHEDQAMDAVKRSGMRAVLAQGVVDFPVPDCPDPSVNVENAIGFVNRSWGEEPVFPGIFCHSPYTCSPQTIVKAKEVCRVHQVPFFIHAAETQWELHETRERYGTTPIRHLDRLGVLDRGSILVHGVWMDEEEIRIVADRGSGIVVCTESHMKLASGIAPLPQFLSHGIRVGLGTDGPASNNDLDLFGEMDLTAKLHKLHREDPTILDAATTLNLATHGGARLLGWEDVGLLEPGYQADLILLRSDQAHLQPLYHPVSQLVYAARGADVTSVWIRGELVMQDRRLLTLDEAEIFREVERLAAKVRLTPHASRLTPSGAPP
jgi:5-methylthioadenosine/S-adenosylhomocysteine deaminase